MAIAVYPGSFDPVTLGHLDIIERSAHMMDHLIVGVLQNNSKTPLFSVEERVKMLEDVTSYLPNVEVRAIGGLLVDFVHQCQADVIVRGLRAITDFEYELQMAQTNHKLEPSVETVFLTTSLEYSYLSSTIVKEVAFYHGDISKFVPDVVRERIREKMNQKGECR